MKIICQHCGRALDESRFQLIRGRYRRHTCNSCRWKLTIRPSRKMAILIDNNSDAPSSCHDYEEMF